MIKISLIKGYYIISKVWSYNNVAPNPQALNKINVYFLQINVTFNIYKFYDSIFFSKMFCKKFLWIFIDTFIEKKFIPSLDL